ncbi:MAG TPA: DUF1800 domain-containing protein [Gemmataceae bacterium]|jgi:uncharacterized protein (DUF1800 family)|nr:DUF1800 domain-containing protein [Gemmataceae bacterium]
MTLKSGPWSPYEPTVKDPWDLRKVAHLHRRAGFGATWAELQRDLKDGPGASVDRLLKSREETEDERQVLDSLRQGVLDSRDSERLKAWWLYRILYDPDPLREKVTLFWHGHFATSNRKVQSIPLMLQQNELLRRHALGNFAELLTGIVSDGAMLLWLDGAGSKKARPNENFARESLELFTLGIGQYTEADIRQAARAFTGWVRERDDSFEGKDKFHFEAAEFDDGPKMFLRQKGPWKAADIVRIVLEQPAAAEFLCRKLYRFFISESKEPAADLLRPLAEELRGHKYSIRHVLGVMLRSRHFYARMAHRKRIMSPVEFSAGLLRSLEVPRAQVSLLALAVACERQGQELFHPPNVKGWDGGKSWLNSTTVLERGNWAADVIWGNPDLGLAPYEPLAWARQQGLPPEKAAAAFVELLLQGDLSDKARGLVLQAGRDGKADSLRKAVQRAVHCPEYQLA